MSGIQPQSLSNQELIRYAEMQVYKDGLPIAWQRELLKRFESVAPERDYRYIDPKQRNLF